MKILSKFAIVSASFFFLTASYGAPDGSSCVLLINGNIAFKTEGASYTDCQSRLKAYVVEKEIVPSQRAAEIFNDKAPAGKDGSGGGGTYTWDLTSKTTSTYNWVAPTISTYNLVAPTTSTYNLTTENKTVVDTKK
ncbi:MAG: hypothetical protein ACOYMG_26595 [Candidatus Methylumidiphilus sp.]